MVKKPTSKSKAKRKAGPKKARRTTARKHQARRSGQRGLAALFSSSFMKSVGKRLSVKVRVPGMGHDVAFSHILAFVAVLGLAIGAGYGGAQALFGAKHTASRTMIQQTQTGANVILPDANGHAASRYPYEEKVAEDIYVAPPSEGIGIDEQVASLPPAQSRPPISAPTMELWRKNALDYRVQGGAPLIAIVIDDMGVDRGRSKRMWENVPGPLTLSFMTYAEDLGAQTRLARTAGHELMLHMPLEPSSAAVDPGPNVLRTSMNDAKLDELAQWGMNRFEGFVGVNNHMGSRFTEDRHAMRVVLEAVHRHGVFFLDSRTTAKSVARTVGQDLGMAVLERNVFLDNDNDVEKVLHQLEQVERLARSHGSAIAIGHPRDATIEVLKTWIPEARARGLEIVPVSALYKRYLDAVGAKTAQPG